MKRAHPARLFSLLAFALFCIAFAARAEHEFFHPSGQRVAVLEDDGEFRIKGAFTWTGAPIPRPLESAGFWKVEDGGVDPKIVLLLALDSITLSGTLSGPEKIRMEPGDLRLKGVILPLSDPPRLAPSDLLGLYSSEPSPRLIAVVDAAGNLKLRTPPGGAALAQIREGSFSIAIGSARIETPPFEQTPADLDWFYNGGSAKTDPQGFYSQDASAFGNGDYWALTWTRNLPPPGGAELIAITSDGYGASFDPYYGAAYADGPNRRYPTTVPGPRIAVNRFTGVPGAPGGMSAASGGLAFGHGESIARFHLNSLPIPVEQGQWDFILQNPYYDNCAHRMTKGAHVRSSLLIRGALYGAFYDWDNNYPPGFESDVPPFPLAPNKHAYILKSPESSPGAADWGKTWLGSAPDTGIGRITITNGGSGYQPGNLVATSGGGSGLAGTYSVDSSGAVESVTITNAGSGYAAAPTVRPSNPGGTGSGAALAAQSGNIRKVDFAAMDAAGEFIADNWLFTSPNFIQYGMAYSDYDLAFPSESDSARYVYALSAHVRCWQADALYLGRAQIFDAAWPGGGWNPDRMMQKSSWEFFAGFAPSGQPLWTLDVLAAIPAIYAPSELGLPSVMYHRATNRYLMTTFTASDNLTLDGWPDPAMGDENDYNIADPFGPVGLQYDARWFLWEAPSPWGPWRKLLTNDYNGRQTDCVGCRGVGTIHGFFGYNATLVPSLCAPAPGGGWEIYVLQAGFITYFQYLQDHPYWNEYPWSANYSSQGIKILLDPAPAPLSGAASATISYQQNNTRRNDFSGSAGARFQVSRPLAVTHLGRYAESDNHASGSLPDRTHRLRVLEVAVSGDTATSVALVAEGTIDLAAPALRDENAFVYASVGATSATAALLPGRDYLLLSDERAGGDFWYGGVSSNKILADTSPPEVGLPGQPVDDFPDSKTGFSVRMISAAIETGEGSGVWTLDPSDYHPKGDPANPAVGNGFGPLNFLYSEGSELLFEPSGAQPVLSRLATTDTLAGVEFTVRAGGALAVAELGVLRAASGPAASAPDTARELRLLRVDETPGAPPVFVPLAAVALGPAAPADSSGFSFAKLGRSIVLEAGRKYLLVAREHAGQNYSRAPLTLAPAGAAAAEAVRPGVLTLGPDGAPLAWNPAPAGAHAAPVNLKFN